MTVTHSTDRRDFLQTLGLAGLVAGFGMCSCFGCRTNEFTQRKQLLIIPESQERELGVAAYQEVKTKNKLSANAKYVEVVQRVGQRLAEAAKQRNLGSDFEWEFAVIADKTQNAFCLPGGKVAFYEGILPICQSEAGIAVVMSHEVSHALARHGGERMSQQSVSSGVGKIVQAVAKKQAEDKEQLVMTVYGAAAQYGVILPYSRSHESEADVMGIHLMAQAGYDPNEAPKFWERFGASNDGKKPAEFLSTHPSDERRASTLRNLLPEVLREYEAAPVKHGLGVQIG